MDTSHLLLGIGAGIIVGLAVYRLMSSRLKEGDLVPIVIPTDKEPSALSRALSSALALVSRFLPLDERATADLDMSLALSGSDKTALQLWAEQIACALIGFAAGGIISANARIGLSGWIVLALGSVIGFLLPRLAIVVRRRGWHRQIERDLPDMLDLLCVAVNSGSTLDDGFRLVAQSMDGPLANACAMIVRNSTQESAADGFLRFADLTGSTQAKNIAVTIKHATEQGSSVSKALLEQSKLMRRMAKLEVDEKAALLDNQLTVVCGVLIMPAAFLAIICPFIYEIYQQLLASGIFG